MSGWTLDWQPIAARQHGIIGRQQLVGLGLTGSQARRFLANDHWRTVFPGVYSTRVEPVSDRGMAWAGLLYAGDDAALSHGTALWWDEVLDQAPDRVHLTIPSSRRVVTKKGLRIHRSVVTAESVHPSRTPRRTRIEHSVLGYLDSAGPEPVIDVLTRVVQRRMTTAARLRDALIERGRHPHRSLIVDVLTDVEQGVQSPPSAATSATSSASIACREESATAPRGSARQRGTATSGMPGGPWWSSWTDGRPIRLRAHSGTTGGTTNSPWRATPCAGSAGPMWWADPVTSLRRWPPRCGPGRMARRAQGLPPPRLRTPTPQEKRSVGKKVRSVAVIPRPPLAANQTYPVTLYGGPKSIRDGVGTPWSRRHGA